MDWLHPLESAAAPEDPWTPFRRPPRHSDESLTGTARHWLRDLPRSVRPLQLCVHHPRVANRLAWAWADAAEAEAVFEDLLVDRRGGRRGFARPIALELERLRAYNADGRAGPPAHAPWLRAWRPALR